MVYEIVTSKVKEKVFLDGALQGQHYFGRSKWHFLGYLWLKGLLFFVHNLLGLIQKI